MPYCFQLNYQYTLGLTVGCGTEACCGGGSIGGEGDGTGMGFSGVPCCFELK